MSGDIESGITILRTTVESALEAPFSITVTSAHRGDGKTEVAVGLARAFSVAGYRTIVIDANPASPNVHTELGVGRLRPPASLDDFSGFAPTKVTPFLDAASIADDSLIDSSSSGTLRSFIEDLRGRYAVTIWDAGDVFSTSVALQCSGASDGTILAVRYGRNPTSEDARLIAALEQVGGRIIGVVPTEFPAERSEGRSSWKRTETNVGDASPSGVRRAGKSIA